jgi:hypothetical protein
MVGPPSAADRALDRRRVAAGLVGVVTLSAVLSGVYGGATLPEIGLLAAVGAATGVALVVAMGTWT